MNIWKILKSFIKIFLNMIIITIKYKLCLSIVYLHCGNSTIFWSHCPIRLPTHNLTKLLNQSPMCKTKIRHFLISITAFSIPYWPIEIFLDCSHSFLSFIPCFREGLIDMFEVWIVFGVLVRIMVMVGNLWTF